MTTTPTPLPPATEPAPLDWRNMPAAEFRKEKDRFLRAAEAEAYRKRMAEANARTIRAAGGKI